MEHLIVSVVGIVLVLVAAYVVWRVNPDFARNSSRAIFMRDLAKRSEAEGKHTDPPKPDAGN